MESTNGFGEVYFVGLPTGAPVVSILDHFDRQTAGVLEVDEGLSEAFVDSAMHHPVFIEVVDPESEGSLRHRVDRRLNLAGARTALNAPIGEGGHHRTRLGFAVGVIQVIVGVAAIEEYGLFNQALADDSGKEVDILLGAACAGCDVVESGDGVIHWVFLECEWSR